MATAHGNMDEQPTASPEADTPPSPAADGPLPLPAADEPAAAASKPPRGPRRLLRGLQRMSSSPSLRFVGRARAVSAGEYRGGARASMSCVSLAPAAPGPSAAGHAHAGSYGSQYSTTLHASPNGLATPPSSAVATPHNGEMGCLDLGSRVRVFGRHELRAHHGYPTTAKLPADMCIGSSAATRVGTPLPNEVLEDPMEAAAAAAATAEAKKVNLWSTLPDEIQMAILSHLRPRELIRSAAVSRRWHALCFDGQLWAQLDASSFYRDIPAAGLVRLLAAAGPFVRELNLRGCVQLRERWARDGRRVAAACRNLEAVSLDGCRLDGRAVHAFLLASPRLAHVNLAGLPAVNNAALRILAQRCPRLELLDVSWCPNLDTAGLRGVVRACPRLRDLRAAEVPGWADPAFLADVFARNSLERLLLQHCTDLTDDALLMLLQGPDPPVDVLTDRALVPPRRWRHLDLLRCRALTDRSVARLAAHAPLLEGLRLSQCPALTDAAVRPLFGGGGGGSSSGDANTDPGCPRLTHLDLEELALTNEALQALARGPGRARLRHLNLSYCEALGDAGVLAVLQGCPALRSLELDNTRASDLSLAEAAAQARARNRAATAGTPSGKPEPGFRLVAYDCPNVTWTGVREVLSRNAEFFRRPSGSNAPPYPVEVVQLKCFYGYQQTVDEHTRRVLRGELARATLLERRWAASLLAAEEAGASGGVGGGRRRRRRAREAERLHAAEQAEDGAEAGRGGRRRARTSGACVVM